MNTLEKFLEELLILLNGQPPWQIYIFLFLGSFLENLLPPIPGDTLIVFGAYLAGIGIIGVVPAYFSMWLGSVIGCMLVYGVVYLKGRAIFLKWESKIFSEINLKKAEDWFSRYGDRLVIFNRFLPTVRAFVGIGAGITRIHPFRMLVYVLLGTFLWNSLLVYFGLMLGENWRLVIDILRAYNQVILVLVVLAGISYWFWHRNSNKGVFAPDSDRETDLD